MSKEEYTYTAVDVVYDSKKKVYSLVTLGYDLVTKRGEVISKEVIGDSRSLAVMAAKKSVVNKVLAINIDLPVKK